MKTNQEKAQQLRELNRKIRNAQAKLRRLEKRIEAIEPKTERDTETLDWVELNNWSEL